MEVRDRAARAAQKLQTPELIDSAYNTDIQVLIVTVGKYSVSWLRASDTENQEYMKKKSLIKDEREKLLTEV